MFRRWLVALLLAALATASAACPGKTRPFVWADDFPEGPAPAGEYRIASRDVIAIRVWNQDPMSVPAAKVRDDGKISLPFLQDVQAEGLTPGELAGRLQVALEKFVLNPVVTVTLEQRATVGVSVLGEVTNPGAFDLSPGAVLLHALAAAGGLTEYADKSAIYVLRPGVDGKMQRIRFRYESLTAGAPHHADFVLHRGDIIVVE